ncbi:MAG: hypothetical protein IJU44_13080 [Kiritimatiellae bacterium]|nr:hypothetical protein [Kiritimatiellia bacterium]
MHGFTAGIFAMRQKNDFFCFFPLLSLCRYAIIPHVVKKGWIVPVFSGCGLMWKNGRKRAGPPQGSWADFPGPFGYDADAP